MRKPKITMTVIKEDSGYSATASIKNRHMNTEGETLDELKKNIVDAVNLSFSDLGFKYRKDEIVLKPDIHNFFELYRVINAKALSERIGMNQSLLAQYIIGTKTPSLAQTQRIFKGVKEIGRELASIEF